MDKSQVSANLCSSIPKKLVNELLEAYDEAKTAFFNGGLRLSEVEGGRFCEASFRILEHISVGKFTPLNRQINTENIISNLANLNSQKFTDSIRIHIPRSLRLVYDIRNKRDAAHLADGIDSLKNPETDVERVACLAHFLTHSDNLPQFKTKDITEANTAATLPALSNPSQSVNNATNQNKYLSKAGKGQKQLTSLGEDVVNALPDRDKVKEVLERTARTVKRRKRAAKPKSSSKSSRKRSR